MATKKKGARVKVTIAPGGERTITATNVADIRAQLGLPAEWRVWRNGLPVESDSEPIRSGDRVVVAGPVKGG